MVEQPERTRPKPSCTSRLTMAVACVIGLVSLGMRMAINMNVHVAIWWLFLPQPWAIVLSAIVDIGTGIAFGILLGIVYEFVFKGEREFWI